MARPPFTFDRNALGSNGSFLSRFIAGPPFAGAHLKTHAILLHRLKNGQSAGRSISTFFDWFRALVQSNTSAGVSDIAQIPDGQKRQVKTINTPSQSVRSSIQAVLEPIRVPVASLRNRSGERKYHASAFNAAGRFADSSPTRNNYRRCRVYGYRVFLGRLDDWRHHQQTCG